jgi:cytochrome c
MCGRAEGSLVGSETTNKRKFQMKKWVLAAVMALAAPAVASAQDAEAGKAQFNKCRACHQIGEGAKNALGPALNGVIGRKAGTVEGFTGYSEALKASGITWDDAKLTEWIQADDKVVPGNKMIFPGIKDAADAANVVAYIKSAGGEAK